MTTPGTRGLVFEEAPLFDLSVPGRIGAELPPCDVTEDEAGAAADLPAHLRRVEITDFPELSEPQVMRHFLRLSQWNFGVDSGFYPLGSCTMKYNPKVNEAVARLDGFAQLHPHQPIEQVQGALQLAFELQQILGEISGLPAVSLHPSAGAQGELTGLYVIRAYHTSQGNPRKRVLIPDTAHGTNPASAVLCGYDVVEVPSGEDGVLHPDTLAEYLDEDVAALMLTNPNTLGLFESHIDRLAEQLHAVGALLYMDGANLNAMMGITRPGEQGVDVMHFNLHKTFSTPHGGGGPGSGPVGVVEALAPFLPNPLVVRRDDGQFGLTSMADRPESIGQVRAHLGNFGILVRAYTYIREMGAAGLRRVTELAVLHANYVRVRLRGHYPIPYDRICMHEVVATTSGVGWKRANVDVAKRLIDCGFHPPTMSFPLVVEDALMIEPTETETRETIDAFCDAMIAIRAEMDESPESLHEAPVRPVVRRLDETLAARKPRLRWTPGE